MSLPTPPPRVIVDLEAARSEDLLRIANALGPLGIQFHVGPRVSAHANRTALVAACGFPGTVVRLSVAAPDADVWVALEDAVSWGAGLVIVPMDAGLPRLLEVIERASERPAPRGRETRVAVELTERRHTSLEERVRFAHRAFEAKVRNFVCSADDLAAMRADLGTALTLESVTITPALRARDASAPPDVPTAAEALGMGAWFLLIGEPICSAPDPRAALGDLWREAEAPFQRVGPLVRAQPPRR